MLAVNKIVSLLLELPFRGMEDITTHKAMMNPRRKTSGGVTTESPGDGVARRGSLRRGHMNSGLKELQG